MSQHGSVSSSSHGSMGELSTPPEVELSELEQRKVVVLGYVVWCGLLVWVCGCLCAGWAVILGSSCTSQSGYSPPYIKSVDVPPPSNPGSNPGMQHELSQGASSRASEGGRRLPPPPAKLFPDRRSLLPQPGLLVQLRRPTTLPLPSRLPPCSVPWQTEDATLQQHFSHYGAVEEAQIMREKYTGKSRGFGFVTFHNTSEASVLLRRPRSGRAAPTILPLPADLPCPPKFLCLLIHLPSLPDPSACVTLQPTL